MQSSGENSLHDGAKMDKVMANLRGQDERIVQLLSDIEARSLNLGSLRRWMQEIDSTCENLRRVM